MGGEAPPTQTPGAMLMPQWGGGWWFKLQKWRKKGGEKNGNGWEMVKLVKAWWTNIWNNYEQWWISRDKNGRFHGDVIPRPTCPTSTRKTNMFKNHQEWSKMIKACHPPTHWFGGAKLRHDSTVRLWFPGLTPTWRGRLTTEKTWHDVSWFFHTQ